MTISVLVLGCDGMVGNAVFKYLRKNKSLQVFGAARKNFDNNKIYRLDVNSFEEDFINIPRVNYVINCIAVLKDVSEKEFVEINATFPQKLSLFLSKKNTKLIHISTDAVFAEDAGPVNENEIPNPSANYNNAYAVSKLQGEVNKKPHITIRTSLLGIGLTGLLNDLINSKDTILKGFTNQLWSGCTSVQFARFCEDIICVRFDSQINDAEVIHFAPIGPITKYEIVKSVNEVFGLQKKVKEEKSLPITRYLTSEIIDLARNPRYTNSIHEALIELKEFYKL